MIAYAKMFSLLSKQQKEHIMQYTKKSRKLKTDFEFYLAGEYVYVTLTENNTIVQKQICDQGNFIGSTITFYGSNFEEFKKVCDRWYRSYMKLCREFM